MGRGYCPLHGSKNIMDEEVEREQEKEEGYCEKL